MADLERLEQLVDDELLVNRLQDVGADHLNEHGNDFVFTVPLRKIP